MATRPAPTPRKSINSSTKANPPAIGPTAGVQHHGTIASNAKKSPRTSFPQQYGGSGDSPSLHDSFSKPRAAEEANFIVKRTNKTARGARRDKDTMSSLTDKNRDLRASKTTLENKVGKLENDLQLERRKSFKLEEQLDGQKKIVQQKDNNIVALQKINDRLVQDNKTIKEDNEQIKSQNQQILEENKDIRSTLTTLMKRTETSIEHIIKPMKIPLGRISSGSEERLNIDVRGSGRAQLLKATEMGNYHFISKHVDRHSFIANNKLGGTCLISYNLNNPRQKDYIDFSMSKQDTVRDLVTLSNCRHVVVGRDYLYMCDNAEVRKSIKCMGYNKIVRVNADKFVTLSDDTGEVQYHNAISLDIMERHELGISFEKLGDDTFLLCTTEGNLIIKAYDNTHQISTKGEYSKVNPLHMDILLCHNRTVCMDKLNRVFGVDERGHPEYGRSIYMFTLDGHKEVIGKLDTKVSSVLSAGIDESCNIYITYTDNMERTFIVKYAIQ